MGDRYWTDVPKRTPAKGHKWVEQHSKIGYVPADGGLPLTERQHQLIKFICAYTREHGFPPRLREMGVEMNICSTNGVNDHLRQLARKGMLRPRTWGRSRDSVPTDRGWVAGGVTPPQVGTPGDMLRAMHAGDGPVVLHPGTILFFTTDGPVHVPVLT